MRLRVCNLDSIKELVKISVIHNNHENDNKQYAQNCILYAEYIIVPSIPVYLEYRGSSKTVE